MLSLEGARSFFTIDEPGDLDSIRPKREPVVMRHDVDHDAMPGAHACRPGVLHSPIGAAVEIGVLCEMVEGVARHVEAGSNIMAAIISRTPIRATGASMVSPTALGCLIDGYLPPLSHAGAPYDRDLHARHLARKSVV